MEKQQFTAENIDFLMNGIGISTERLASLLEINIDKMRLYQSEGLPISGYISANEIEDLIKISNYFTVFVGCLFSFDIDTTDFFDKKIFDKIKAELNEDSPYDRQSWINSFFEEVSENKRLSKLIENERGISLVHQLNVLQTEYNIIGPSTPKAQKYRGNWIDGKVLLDGFRTGFFTPLSKGVAGAVSEI